MKVITNEALIAKRKKWANLLVPIGVSILVAGLVTDILSISKGADGASYFDTAILLLIIGYLFTSIGSSLVNRWVREPRADQVLSKTLKGFDNKHVLFNYTSKIPHVLITQNKVFAITTKPQGGEVSVINNKWKRPFSFSRLLFFFSEEHLGNPSSEAQYNAKTLAKHIQKHISDDEAIVIEPLIVFTNPKVTLTVDNCDVPVLESNQFKKFIREANKGPAFKAPLRKKLVAALSE